MCDKMVKISKRDCKGMKGKKLGSLCFVKVKRKKFTAPKKFISAVKSVKLPKFKFFKKQKNMDWMAWLIPGGIFVAGFVIFLFNWFIGLIVIFFGEAIYFLLKDDK